MTWCFNNIASTHIGPFATKTEGRTVEKGIKHMKEGTDGKTKQKQQPSTDTEIQVVGEKIQKEVQTHQQTTWISGFLMMVTNLFDLMSHMPFI
jgi:hypothetical protein